ncbi:MAG: hypothetical protein ACRDVL_07985 [Acidimicrobiia bacterium]
MASWPWRLARWVGLAFHLVAGFFYLGAGLLAPLYAVAALLAVWVVLLALAIWQWRRRPWWVLVTPFVAGAIWFGVLTLGDIFLGWTA